MKKFGGFIFACPPENVSSCERDIPFVGCPLPDCHPQAAHLHSGPTSCMSVAAQFGQAAG